MDSLITLLTVSAQRPENSHVVLVVPTTLSLIWLSHERIFREVSTGLVPGLILVGIGIGVRLTSHIFQSSIGSENSLNISILSLIFVCVGAFVFVYGTPATVVARFPLLLLGLLVPLPSYIVRWFNFGLQYGSTVAVDWFLYLAGVPYHREGFVLFLPVRSIEIAEECSGLRAAIILLVLSIVIAHLYLRTMVFQIFLVAASIPISIIKNGIRILTLSLLSNYVDPNILDSGFHHHGGIVFFAISIAALYLSTLILRWLEERILEGFTGQHRRIGHSLVSLRRVLPQR
jgi:exosortase